MVIVYVLVEMDGNSQEIDDWTPLGVYLGPDEAAAAMLDHITPSKGSDWFEIHQVELHGVLDWTGRPNPPPGRPNPMPTSPPPGFAISEKLTKEG